MKIEFYNDPVNKESITFGDLCLGDVFEQEHEIYGSCYCIKTDSTYYNCVNIVTGQSCCMLPEIVVKKYNAPLRFDKDKFITEKKDL